MIQSEEEYSAWSRLFELDLGFNIEAEVSPALGPNREDLVWKCYYYRILLYRPYLLNAALSTHNYTRRSNVAEHAIRKCRELTKALIQDICSHCQSDLMSIWQGVVSHISISLGLRINMTKNGQHFISQAVLIPILSIYCEPWSDEVKAWKLEIELVLAFFERFKTAEHLTAAASKAINILWSSVQRYWNRTQAEMKQNSQVNNARLYNQLYGTHASSSSSSHAVDSTETSIIDKSTYPSFIHPLSSELYHPSMASSHSASTQSSNGLFTIEHDQPFDGSNTGTDLPELQSMQSMGFGSILTPSLGSWSGIQSDHTLLQFLTETVDDADYIPDLGF